MISDSTTKSGETRFRRVVTQPTELMCEQSLGDDKGDGDGGDDGGH